MAEFLDVLSAILMMCFIGVLIIVGISFFIIVVMGIYVAIREYKDEHGK